MMRGFGPFVAALVLGAVWVLLSSSVMPSTEEEPGTSGIGITDAGSLSDACAEAALIARMPGIGEASGLAASRRDDNLLWTHNDSGQPVLYGIGRDGTLRAQVQVTGAAVDDWESISAAGCPRGSCLYIADIGDNGGKRSHITVYRVTEPAPGRPATDVAEAFHAAYPDRPQDAEAIFVAPNAAIFIVTKGEDSPISVYRFPAPLRAGATMRLERVGTLAPSAMRSRRVTGADMTWDGRWVAVRTLNALEFYRAADLMSGQAGSPLKVDLSALREPQGEGLAIARDGLVFLAGEGAGGGTLARLSCKLPE